MLNFQIVFEGLPKPAHKEKAALHKASAAFRILKYDKLMQRRNDQGSLPCPMQQ